MGIVIQDNLHNEQDVKDMSKMKEEVEDGEKGIGDRQREKIWKKIEKKPRGKNENG